MTAWNDITVCELLVHEERYVFKQIKQSKLFLLNRSTLYRITVNKKDA